MTQQEKQEIESFLKEVFHRINTAKDQIRQMNYGMALNTLSEAYPVLKIEVNEES